MTLLAMTAAIPVASVPAKDVVDTALDDPQFSTWTRVVKRSGMDSTLNLTPGNYTLFVPTNAAFAKMSPATFKKLFDDSSDGKEALTTF